MTIRRFLAFAAVLVAGFAVGHYTRKPAVQPPSLAGPLTIFRVGQDGSPAEIVPYRVVIDGRGEDLGPAPRDESAEIWRINLDGGRVVIFARRR